MLQSPGGDLLRRARLEDGAVHVVQRRQAIQRIAQAALGQPALGHVLQGFDGTDDLPIGIAQRRRGEEGPLARFAEGRKEVLRLVGAIDQRRASEFAVVEGVDRQLVGTVDDDVGQHRPLFGIEGSPLLLLADDFLGRHACKHFAGPVPVGELVLAVDHEGGHRAAVHDLRQRGHVLSKLELERRPAQAALDRAEQQLALEVALRQIVENAVAHGLDGAAFVALSGDHDDRAGQLTARFDLRQQVGTDGIAEEVVEQHAVEIHLAQLLQCLAA